MQFFRENVRPHLLTYFGENQKVNKLIAGNTHYLLENRWFQHRNVKGRFTYTVANALGLILAKTDNRNEVRSDKVSEDESEYESIPDEPMSEIDDNVGHIAKSSTDDEEYNNEDSEAVGLHDYWSSAV